VSRIILAESDGTGVCPVPGWLQQLEVGTLDLEALAYLPDSVVRALAGNPFKLELVMYNLMEDFDTEAGTQQVSMSVVSATNQPGTAGRFQAGPLSMPLASSGPHCRAGMCCKLPPLLCHRNRAPGI
jgi:hypothetical protein